jgi:chemotaxis protein methyltransferase WspC
MEALGLATLSAYASRLADDAQELQNLLDDVGVPETWFFRGGEVFTYLARQVAETIRNRRERVRILSVPCSTGEEPYSLAIALVEGGVPNAGWTIDAIDLSARLVERARTGKFREFSFRETRPDLRQRYFQPVEGGWELAPTIRALVQFRQGNLLDPLFLAGEGPFDLIFCRNLLIYLHPEARRHALDTLARLLTPDGLVCMGHAEPLDLLDPRFMRAGPGGSFLYRRTTVLQEVARLSGVEATELLFPALSGEAEECRSPGGAPVDTGRFSRASKHSSLGHPGIAQQLPGIETAPAVAAPVLIGPLTQARKLADAGRLDEALVACQTQLAQSEPTADLFSLMGVIHQARGETEDAVRCYERALYLERKHSEALTHLMLLSRERGDHVQAERLRRRLERISPGGEA